MAHFGLSDIQNALKKSGLPLGNANDMRDASAIAGQAIDAGMPRTVVPDNGYRQKLAQIAAMDQKLAGMYSDPTNSMYIENPMARQRLVSGASNQGYQQAGDLKEQQIKQQQEEDRKREELINQTEQYYKALISVQLREEKALKKKGSGTGKVTAVEAYSGIENPKVAKLWRSQLTANQKKRWSFAVGENTPLGNSARVGDGMVPDGGYTEEDVMDFYENEKKLVDKKKADAEKKKSDKENKINGTYDLLNNMLNNMPETPVTK